MSMKNEERLTTDEWLAKVASAGKSVELAAVEADRARRLGDATMNVLHKDLLMRLLVPLEVGGVEMPLPQFVSVIEELAKYDGSAAWCVCQGNACAMLATYLDLSLTEIIWKNDARAVLSWGPGKAEAKAVTGGYQITANTSFASGSHHATWFAAHCSVVEDDGTPRLDGDGVQENRTALFPASEAELGDDWDVVGLRGTGSDGFVVKDLFVPDDHTIVRAKMISEVDIRTSLHGLPQMAVYASGFSAVALGIARGFLDAFTRLAQEKIPRGVQRRLSDNPAVQDEVARAEARLSGARAFLFDEVNQGWKEVAQNNDMSVQARMRIRLAGTHAIHEAKAVVDTLFDTAGTSAVLASSPFERRFRDIHAVALQIQARKQHYQTYGGWMMGNEVNATNMTVI